MSTLLRPKSVNLMCPRIQLEGNSIVYLCELSDKSRLTDFVFSVLLETPGKMLKHTDHIFPVSLLIIILHFEKSLKNGHKVGKYDT